MAKNDRKFWLLLLVFALSVNTESTLSDESSEVNRREKREAVIEEGTPPLRPSPDNQYEDTPSQTSILEAVLSFQIKESEKLKGACTKGDPTHCSTEEGPCLPLVFCAAYFEEIVESNSFCKLGPNAYGARCPIPKEGSAFKTPLPGIYGNIDPGYEGKAAIADAFAGLENQENVEREIRRSGFVINDPKTPEFSHLQVFRTTPEAVKQAKLGFLQNFAATSLQNSLILKSRAANFSVLDLDIQVPADCSLPPSCEFNDFYYRKHDGSCNNLQNTMWGKTFTAIERISAVRYQDGISIPRRSVTGKPLPFARHVSHHIIHDVDKPSKKFTLSVMQWGQFIDHDVTHSPISRIDNVTGIRCCGQDGLPLPSSSPLFHPECFPIEVQADDPFYSKFGFRCINFVRTVPAPTRECRLGCRNQMNQVSHFLDGSTVYGSSRREADELRTFRNGLLELRDKDLLPDDPSTPTYDFLAGDSRNGEQPQLSVIHTIWARQHNGIALELSNMKPYWDDEKVYQETRRILIGQIQHIVYNEWLPIILGSETMEKYNLLPKRRGFSNSYNQFLNPSILNEFTTAAFRFGHTLVQGTLNLYNKNYESRETIELSDNFDRPQIFTGSRKFDELLRGLFNQPIQEFDNSITDDLTNNLLKTDYTSFGLDLIAFNIQRGRDHGIGTYNDIRAACHMPKVENFDQLYNNMQPGAVPLFPSLYESVEDIDAFVAGVSEKSVQGGMMGEIFNCIVKEQFSRLKFGDRFFYEHGGMYPSFREDQLEEIKKTSWARIICDNSKNIHQIQPLAFRLPDAHNVKVPCSSETIPKLSLLPWYKD